VQIGRNTYPGGDIEWLLRFNQLWRQKTSRGSSVLVTFVPSFDDLGMEPQFDFRSREEDVVGSSLDDIEEL